MCETACYFGVCCHFVCLFGVCYSSCVVVVCCLLQVVCCLLFVVCCLRFTVCCVLLFADCLRNMDHNRELILTADFCPSVLHNHGSNT